MKAERRCTICAAGLQESDKFICVECHEKKLERERSAPRRSPTREQMDRCNAIRMAKKDARSALGKCVDGCGNPSVPGERQCKECRRAHRIAAVETWRARTWPRIAAINLWRAAVAPLRDKNGRIRPGLRKTRQLLGLSTPAKPKPIARPRQELQEPILNDARSDQVEIVIIRDLLESHSSFYVTRTATELFEAVTSEWGEINERRLWRALRWLVDHGKVLRVGEKTDANSGYRRVRQEQRLHA